MITHFKKISFGNKKSFAFSDKAIDDFGNSSPPINDKLEFHRKTAYKNRVIRKSWF